MNLTTLMIVAVIIVVLITVVTILAVNRGYAFNHTIDAKPQQGFNEDKKE